MATAQNKIIYYPFPTSRVSEWAGTWRGNVQHYGTDFAVPQGTRVPATIFGTVVRVGDDGLGAWCIDILRDDGLLVRHGHMSRMDVRVGQRVTPAQIIGLSGGMPGTPGAGFSTGPHLHWELRWDRGWVGGSWVKPKDLNPAPLSFDAPATKPPAPKPKPEETEEDEMAIAVGYAVKGAGYKGSQLNMIVYPASGWYTEWSGASQEYTNKMAAQHKTGNFLVITQSHYDQMKRTCDRMIK